MGKALQSELNKPRRTVSNKKGKQTVLVCCFTGYQEMVLKQQEKKRVKRIRMFKMEQNDNMAPS